MKYFTSMQIFPFSFGHCVVRPSSIYGFWLPYWYLQTLFKTLIRVGCFDL